MLPLEQGSYWTQESQDVKMWKCLSLIETRKKFFVMNYQHC